MWCIQALPAPLLLCLSGRDGQSARGRRPPGDYQDRQAADAAARRDGNVAAAASCQ